MIVRNVEQYGCKISLDLSQQILRLEIPELETMSFDGGVGKSQTPVTPSATLPVDNQFISAATLLLKAKQFDDGLYAAVELACQRGCTGFEGKKFLLQRLCEITTAASSTDKQRDVATILHMAAKLGGLSTNRPADMQLLFDHLMERFLADEKLSKPISFYTWSSELQQIWQQDRALQTALPGAGVGPLISALRNDPALKRIYITYVDLIAKLTNPFIEQSLTAFVVGSDEPQADNYYPMLPASTSPEFRLMYKLFDDNPPPPNFSLIEAIISSLKSGELSLQPSTDSGWYDYSLWAIEPLAIPHTVPESARVRFGERYQNALLELFKGAYALTRETHAKQVAAPGCYGAAPQMKIYVSPELTLEPLPTVYLRRAISYRFIREVLEHSLGERALQEMHRQTARGPLTMTLAEELLWIEQFFYGAHVASCAEIGMAPGALENLDPQSAAETFKRWSVHTDCDISQDARMMVPVYYDQELRKLKVWAFLGWTQSRIHVAYQREPAVLAMDAKSSAHPLQNSPMYQGQTPRLEFSSTYFDASYPLTVETYVDRLLNRDEFRALCDKHGNAEAIVQALRSGG